MKELFMDSVFFGVLISLGSYYFGVWLKEKIRWSLMNPLLISIILVIVILLCAGVSYDSYMKGANFIGYLLTPATICLAVPLYQQVELLKKNYKAVIAGICSSIGLYLPFRSCLLRHFPPEIHHDSHRNRCDGGIGRLCPGNGGGDHHNRSDREYFRREIPETHAHRRADRERYSHRFVISRDRNYKSDGDGCHRRCDEQSLDSRQRNYYRLRRLVLRRGNINDFRKTQEG